MNSNVDYKQIAERIRELRLQCGMTQSELAEIAELSSQYLCQVENGRKHISLSGLIRISEGLGIGLDEFLYGNNNALTYEYDREFYELLKDCTYGERKTLCEILRVTKYTLRKNRDKLFENKDKFESY